MMNFLRSLICFNSDVDEEQEDFDINVDFVDLIKKNKHYVSQIAQGVSDVFLTSERLTPLQNYSNDNGSFINTAKTEQRVNLVNCEEIIGSDLNTYTEELKEVIKKKTVKISTDDVLSGSSRSYQTFDVNIRSLGHTHAIVEFALLPEIITSYLMREKNLNYKDASRLMYGKLLPTEHHLNLLNVSVSFA